MLAGIVALYQHCRLLDTSDVTHITTIQNCIIYLAISTPPSRKPQHMCARMCVLMSIGANTGPARVALSSAINK